MQDKQEKKENQLVENVEVVFFIVIDATHSGTVRGKHLLNKGRECGEEGEGERKPSLPKRD